MQMRVSDKQLKLLIALVQAEMERRGVRVSDHGVCSELDELTDNLELLRGLHDTLVKAKESNAARTAWMGYVKSRKVPSNPPPGT